MLVAYNVVLMMHGLTNVKSFDKIWHVRVATKFDVQGLFLLFAPVRKVRLLMFPGSVKNGMSFTVTKMNSPRLAGFSSAVCE